MFLSKTGRVRKPSKRKGLIGGGTESERPKAQVLVVHPCSGFSNGTCGDVGRFLFDVTTRHELRMTVGVTPWAWTLMAAIGRRSCFWIG